MSTTGDRIECTEGDGYFVLTVILSNQTKYMRAFIVGTNREEALDQVLADIQVSHDKQS